MLGLIAQRAPGFALLSLEAIDLVFEALVFRAQGVVFGQSLLQEVSELWDNALDFGVLYASE